MPTSSPPLRMPSRIGRSKLYGPDGAPLSYWLYPSPRHNLKSYKPRYWLATDTKSNVNEYDRYELVNYARQLYAQIDLLNAAVEQKNNWAFGDAWDAHYAGAYPAWGQEAEEFLKFQFYPLANVRGPQYSLKRSLWLSGVAWDVDGDDCMVTVASPGDFPQLAFYPAPKIATWNSSMHNGKMADAGVVRGGYFDGAKIFDGVIYDRNSRIVGIRVIGEDGDHSDVPAGSADLAYEPKWHDQGRGIPRIAASLLKWMNLQDIDEFLQRGMKRAASIGLIQKNEEGEAPTGNELLTEEADTTPPAPSGQIVGAARNIAYEEVEGGEMYYLSSVGGEGIEALEYENPHPNSEAFVRRVQLCALASIGWHYELTNLGATGRAASRLLTDLANQSIWSRQFTGERRWKRAVSYAIAKAMKTGRLSRNPDDGGMDAYMWEPGLPKQLSVDAGNDEQADRENIKLGTTSKAIVAQKRGWHWKEISRQREDEIRDVIGRATGLAKDYPSLSFERALELLEQRSPNPIQTKITQSAGPVGSKQAANSNEPIAISIDARPTEAPKRRILVRRDKNGAFTAYEEQ